MGPGSGRGRVCQLFHVMYVISHCDSQSQVMELVDKVKDILLRTVGGLVVRQECSGRGLMHT